MAKPEVLARDALFTQVCVPEDWKDTEVQAFAKAQNWREMGWKVKERRPCAMIAGHVHVMLET